MMVTMMVMLVTMVKVVVDDGEDGDDGVLLINWMILLSVVHSTPKN